ncbi:3-hydroxyacyl-CoA dehydrogenase NAD-binding domain-containing protein [Shinella sumterensis]|uniref:3-hydroxyacyl-CoA dehydrogenase NAD-binding domain-containing protein n=1 Tax=Shinella sumterensis TaxID=1967501 RepID=A0AA50DHA8_9HYPH|nr:3-hydroxyacyl-CoA dehydrogenase NAD-binding domain-containing protein [Shinella sumterensis]WLS01071.1 3-hydroxyacyl-CoA dehydrogenase NAD-binding domain-containing protein [Shinella sumterensis]WLS11867.1 3-hydroxyacyl-CoA dehydrogenase NAD-binding domain-containing protein [Shinella sumterensis]
MKAAIVGGGVIGGGWAARFLLNGWDVSLYDKGGRSLERVEQVVSNARASLPLIYEGQLPPAGKLHVHDDLKTTVSDADWVQESVPERLDIKSAVLREICESARPEAVIGSSTSGFMPSTLAETLPGRERFLVAHPFNPVYLLPLVELVPSKWTAAATVEMASEILSGIGMKPLTLRREIDGFIANRLQEAMWRESLWLIHDGIATTTEIDDALRYGFGLRGAQMGQFDTYRAAGGEGGMAHFLSQFGPALKEPVSHLMDVPDLDAELIGTISQQSDEQSGHLTIAELEQLRDRNLVGIIRALKDTQTGAGQTAFAHDTRLKQGADELTKGSHA